MGYNTHEGLESEMVSANMIRQRAVDAELLGHKAFIGLLHSWKDARSEAPGVNATREFLRSLHKEDLSRIEH